MGHFRDLMERDLVVRGMSPATRRSYLATVKRFAAYWKRSPDQMGLEHVHEYLLHLIRDCKIRPGHLNVIVSGLRFFYNVTLKKNWDLREMPYQKVGRRLPEVLSTEEVAALLEAPSNLKHRAILATLYATGARKGELRHLKISDIDSRRMMIRIQQGKGRKDRYVMLSPMLLEILRKYWDEHRPQHWLFPGKDPKRPVAWRTVNHVVQTAAKAAGIRRRVYPHLLRHSFATHLLESGSNVCVIQKLLGHQSLQSTQIYTHVAKTYLQDTASPLDLLNGNPKKT